MTFGLILTRRSLFLITVLMSGPAVSRPVMAQNDEASATDSPTENKKTEDIQPHDRTGTAKGKAKRTQPQPALSQKSIFFPDWSPSSFRVIFHPVLGLQYASNPKSDISVSQGELGAFLGLQGVPLVAGNPGVQLEPGFGYAAGQAFVKAPQKSLESGTYHRVWGTIRTPIYYRFIRQVFEGQYGQTRGGPLPVSKRASFQSDTGVAVVPMISAHYTFTYDRVFGDDAESFELNSYDHWIHGRFAAPILNFYVDAGPGYSLSKSSSSMTPSSGFAQAEKVEGTSSGIYLLGLSGFDLLTDKIGFDASAKYMFSSKTESKFTAEQGRSPLDDLGAQPVLTGLPADSLHVSGFFGLRRVLGAFGIGWRYSLEILNLSEKNGLKQQKRESNGLGVSATVRF
jgi:hypothetical protein